MAGDVARILTRLIGAADDDVLERVEGEAVAADQRGEEAGEEIVRAHGGERTRMAAEGGAQSIVEDRRRHDRVSERRFHPPIAGRSREVGRSKII